jgi:hypothetical protein
MAQKTVLVIEDDINGKPATETVAFAIDGVSYEIDLSDANAARLRKVLAAYIYAGRRVGGSAGSAGARRAVPRSGVTRPAATDREQLSAIRVWARGRGYAVSDRGRIPNHITELYHSAAASPPPAAAPEPDAPAPRKRARKTA